MERGVIKRLPVDRDTGRRRGFGYIETEGGDEVFFHATGLQQTTKLFDEITEGDHVEFTVINGEKGARAIEVRVLL